MVKFSELHKLKNITASLVFIKYSLCCVFLFLQGKAIELAMEQNKLPKQIICTLAGFVLIKLIVMLCDVLQSFITEYYTNSELKKQWSLYIPQTIYRDNQSSKNKIHILFFDYLPRLAEIETAIVMNNVTIYYIFSLTFVVFLYTGFFLGVLALLLVFILNYFSKNIFIKKIDHYQKKTHASKIKILNWLEQYFNSFREISKNWQGIAHSSWKDGIYKNYFIAKNKQIFFYLYRDLLSQVFVELPFLLNTSIVIIGVYYSYLSLSQLFVWIGFSQFMINASNAYLENRVNKKQLATLVAQTNSILDDFDTTSSKEIKSNGPDKFAFAEIKMRDGTSNHLSLDPGIYPIKGGNGSGKSTLMNIILGYDRQYDFENSNLSQLTANVSYENTRVIEREAVIFECLSDLSSQIGGPAKANCNWRLIISESIERLLGPQLAREWMDIFISLAFEYTYRKEKIMSSGEKVILSFMRFFFSWNREVNLLIIDECDAFLDQEKKRLFVETVKRLATSMAVYITCHDDPFNKYLEKSILFSKAQVVSGDFPVF